MFCFFSLHYFHKVHVTGVAGKGKGSFTEYCFLWIRSKDRHISAKELIFLFYLTITSVIYSIFLEIEMFLCLTANVQEGSYPDIVVVVEDSY